MGDKIIIFGSKSCNRCEPHYKRTKSACFGIPVEYHDITESGPFQRDALKMRSLPVTFKVNGKKIKRSLVGAPEDIGVLKKNLGV